MDSSDGFRTLVQKDDLRGMHLGLIVLDAVLKRDEAIKTFALSQGQYQKIAEELEKFGLLTRGENNARVMREISMENLVRQLREDFPLVWSEEHQVWADRTGTFARWQLAEDFRQRKLAEAVERSIRDRKCRCMSCHQKRHTGEIKPKGAEGDRTKVTKTRKPAICKVLGCPVFATGSGKKPDKCWKHQ